MTSDDRLRQQRQAENEAIFREVNKQIVGLNETFAAFGDHSVFVCECSRIGCAEQVELTLDEYQAVRSKPNRFFVLPDEQHVIPEIERVVERHDRYLVVEKRGEAAEAVEALDRN